MERKSGTTNLVIPPFSFRFLFLPHVDLLFLAVIELVLQETHLLRGDDVHANAVSHLPFPFQGDESLVDVGSHIRVDMQIELLNADLVDQGINLTLQLVSEKNA